ncbi:MAG: hypothetical protein HQ553_04340 [Chloroflexi bacterium]|nr:hypothetical protein [Chloroflexota bacterium]
MKLGLNILLTISVLILCLVGATACDSNSSDAAEVVDDIIVHKGEVTHTETWETVDNKGVFIGYRSVVRGEAENVGNESIYRPYVQITVLGPEDAELGQDIMPLGVVNPGDRVKIKAEVISDTAYAVDFEWELIPWPMIATVEQLEASQWDDYYDDPDPARWPMITGAIAVAIALALMVLFFIIFRRRRRNTRKAAQMPA